MEKEENLNKKTKAEDHSEEFGKVKDQKKEAQTKPNSEIEEKEIPPEDKIKE